MSASEVSSQHDHARRQSTLVIRNVVVAGRRTSIRLEPAMWDALEEICAREQATAHEIADRVERSRHESSLTAAMRVYILGYFRSAATERGHADVGHGSLAASTGKATSQDRDVA